MIQSIKLILIASITILFLLLSPILPVFAGSDSKSHVVTVKVPALLSIEADVSDFTLTFSDFLKGSTTDKKDVTYTIKGNNVTRTSDVLTAKLDQLFTGTDLKADVGSYTKLGGNASLVEKSSGFVTVGTQATGLCKRRTDSGTGKLLRGKLLVTYQGKASADLQEGEETRTLTVTVTDT